MKKFTTMMEIEFTLKRRETFWGWAIPLKCWTHMTEEVEAMLPPHGVRWWDDSVPAPIIEVDKHTMGDYPRALYHLVPRGRADLALQSLERADRPGDPWQFLADKLDVSLDHVFEIYEAEYKGALSCRLACGFPGVLSPFHPRI